MDARLNGLDQIEADALALLTLKGTQPPTIAAMNMSAKIFDILVRDPLLGWNIAIEHRAYVKKWAAERQKHSRK